MATRLRDGAEEIPVVGVVMLLLAVAQPGQGQAHHAQQLAAGTAAARPRWRCRRRRRRPGCPGAAGKALVVQVGPRRRPSAGHRLLAEVPHRVADLLADRRPGAGAGIQPRACTAARRTSLSPWNRSMKQWSANCGTSVSATCRSVTPSSSEWASRSPMRSSRAEPVMLALAAPPGGLAGEDDDAVDRAGRVPQRRPRWPGRRARAVARGGWRTSPPRTGRAAPAGRELDGLRRVLDPRTRARARDRPTRCAESAGNAEERDREGVRVDQVVSPVGDHHSRLDLVQDVRRAGQAG